MSFSAQKFRQQIRRISRKSLRSGTSWRKNVRLAFFSMAFAFFGLASAQYYQQHVMTLPDGALFWGEELTGLTRAEAEDKVQGQIWDWYQQEIEVLVQREGQEDTRIPLTVSELGFEYDVKATVQQFLQVSAGQLAADVLHGAAEEAPRPVMVLESQALDVLLDRVISHEEAPQDARIFLDEDREQWLFEEHRAGSGLGPEQQLDLAQQLHQLALKPESGAELRIALQSLDPEIFDTEMEPLYERVQELLGKTLLWNVDGFEVQFSLQDYPWVIEVDEENDLVFVSRSELRKQVDEWAKMFDREASQVFVSEPALQDKGHLRSSFNQVFENGRKLDREQFTQDLLVALDQDEDEVLVELPSKVFTPQVKSWEGDDLTLLSQGRSSYALAHSDDRLFNVKFGLAKYDGVVIPEGAEFSYNQILGWVTYAAGWKPALAIFGGGGVKPVPGGGLCQVSTTVFRAAVHEGLQITQRKPHSLDVSYYHAYGDGIDATIYPPADLDLKFVNNTPGPIVIHTYLDESAEEVFVEFYGIDDGREVSLEQTINRPVKLPPEVVYTDQLAPGEKEVITARAGRYVEWDWKVTNADGTVDDRLIESLYPARRQTVRVGIGE
jgi:vancomycin resistance protein YoaR